VSLHGILVVDKPRGPTSHDVVAAARRLLGTRAIGHAGTLDPMASGVLVLLVGEATKLAPYVTSEDKAYCATVAFGRATDTLDAEGTTTEQRAPGTFRLDPAALERALVAERARTLQVPPSFSAISVGGVRAHRLSRSGKAVELAERPVAVRSLSLVERREDSVTLRVEVSKGYYVRALARDLGAALELPAHLAALSRTASGAYRIADAVPWPPPGEPRLETLETAAGRVLPVARLRTEGVERAFCGKRLSGDHFETPANTVAAWFAPDGGLIAVGELSPTGDYQVIRGFRHRSSAAMTRS
jgi:tRNA pseudouridine55 synthase